MTTERPQRETREETASTTSLLREERLAREQKMARERALLDGADEVRYRESGFRPGRAASVEEARAGVDALVVQRRAMPEPEPVPVVEPPTPPMDEAKRALLAPLVEGSLVALKTRFRTSEGEVVEATYESSGARRSGVFLLTRGQAKRFDDLSAAIDALPMPAPPTTAPAVPPPVEETPVVEPTPAEESRKKSLGSRFKLGKGKADKPETEAAPSAPAAAPPEEKKGLASRFRRDKPKAEETAAPANVEEAPAEGPEKPGKRRFPFGRK